MYRYITLLLVLLFASCNTNERVALRIISCVNLDGTVIQENIELIINGRYLNCDPNNDLILWFNRVNQPIDISISVNSDRYIMLSDKNYSMDPSRGLDITLMFENTRRLASSETSKSNTIISSNSRDPELLEFISQTQVDGIRDENINIDSLLAVVEYYGDSELTNMSEEQLEMLPDQYDLLLEAISNIISENQNLMSDKELENNIENEVIAAEEPEEEKEIEIVTTADITFVVEPDDVEINLLSEDSDYTDSFTGSVTVNLNEGTYRFTATKKDYIQESGLITVVAGNNRSATISLEPRVIVPASISLIISPKDSEISFTELNTKQVSSYSTSQNSIVELPPGSYTYSITAQGFSTFENNIIFEEGVSYTLMKTLESISITSFTEEANQIQGLREAVQLYSRINIKTLPQVQRSKKIEFVDAMVPIAKILNNGGEAIMAEELYSELLEYMPSHIQLRQSYGRLLIDLSKFDEAISLLRPIYGNLINSVNPEQREIISFEARYWTAFSAYQRFRSTPESEVVDKENFANSAYAYLMDVTSRFESNRENLAPMEDYYNKATTYLKLLNVR